MQKFVWFDDPTLVQVLRAADFFVFQQPANGTMHYATEWNDRIAAWLSEHYANGALTGFTNQMFV